MSRQNYKNILRRYLPNNNVTKRWHLELSVFGCLLSVPKNAYFWVDGEIN